MIKITLKIGSGLCGIRSIHIKEMDIAEGVLAADFLIMLSKEFGKDLLKPTVLVVLNGTKLSESDKKTTILKNGDNVSMFEALVGG
ncbi:MAG: MoaD/ThiS family protein [Caulobacteraceae bacterium]